MITQSETARKGACKSCGAEVVWLQQENGKWQICDRKPKQMYVQKIIYIKSGTVGRVPVPVWELENCFQSHFVTCPDAKAWRKKGVKSSDQSS